MQEHFPAVCVTKGSFGNKNQQLCSPYYKSCLFILHTTQAALTSTVYIHCQASKSICSKAFFRYCCLPHCSCQTFLPSASGSRSAVGASSGQILPGCFFQPESVTHWQQSWIYFSLNKQIHPLIFTSQPNHHHTAASHKCSLRNHAGGKIPLYLTNTFSIQCRKQIGEFSPTGYWCHEIQSSYSRSIFSFHEV